MIVLPSMTGFIGGPKRDPRSINFASASSQYLSMSDADFGSYTSAKFAISLWFNGANNHNGSLISQEITPDNYAFTLGITNEPKFFFRTSSDSNNNDGVLVTNIIGYASQWNHLMVHYDSANGTADNRMRMWINGSEITTFSSRTNPSSGVYNSTADITIGRSDGSNYFNGLMYQIAFFDNSLPALSDVVNTPGLTVKDISGVSGLKSLLQPTAASIIDDSVLTPNWTNNNTATASTSVPT